MRIGVFAVLYKQFSLSEEAPIKLLPRAPLPWRSAPAGTRRPITALIDELLTSAQKRKTYLKAVESRGLITSALSCHSDPINPDPQMAKDADEVFRKSVKLAERLGVPVVNDFSGLPAGAPGDKCPTGSPAPGRRTSRKFSITSGTRWPSPTGGRPPNSPRNTM